MHRQIIPRQTEFLMGPLVYLLHRYCVILYSKQFSCGVSMFKCKIILIYPAWNESGLVAISFIQSFIHSQSTVMEFTLWLGRQTKKISMSPMLWGHDKGDLKHKVLVIGKAKSSFHVPHHSPAPQLVKMWSLFSTCQPPMWPIDFWHTVV
jgi:hypothetical protein